MDDVAPLRLGENVSTRGTNWSSVGEARSPAWRNETTDHHLIIEPATSNFEYAVKLNHPDQTRPWWTVTELDFAAELLPIVEWFLSTPEDVLWNREAVAYVLEPFWEKQDADTSSKQSY